MLVAFGSQNLRVDDDGLMTPEVGGWAETKYRLLALYDELFSTGMKNKWDERVYLDLYAGAGYSRIQGTGKFLKASPMIALTVAHPFDKYIFLRGTRRPTRRLEGSCEADRDPSQCGVHPRQLRR